MARVEHGADDEALEFMRPSRLHDGKAFDVNGNRLAALMELGLLLGRGDGGFDGDYRESGNKALAHAII